MHDGETSDRLERAYRVLLRAYPADFRKRHGDGMVDTLLEMSPVDSPKPSLAMAGDLLLGGICFRLGVNPNMMRRGWLRAGPIALSFNAAAAAYLLLWGEPPEPMDSAPVSAQSYFPTGALYLLWVAAAVLRLLPGRLWQAVALLALVGTPLIPLLGPNPYGWIEGWLHGGFVFVGVVAVIGRRNVGLLERATPLGGCAVLVAVMFWIQQRVDDSVDVVVGFAALGLLIVAAGLALDITRDAQTEWAPALAILLFPIGYLAMNAALSIRFQWNGDVGYQVGRAVVIAALAATAVYLLHRGYGHAMGKVIRPGQDRLISIAAAAAVGLGAALGLNVLLAFELTNIKVRIEMFAPVGATNPLAHFAGTTHALAYLVWIGTALAWATGQRTLTRLALCAATIATPAADLFTGFLFGSPSNFLTEPGNPLPAMAVLGAIGLVGYAPTKHSTRVMPVLVMLVVPLTSIIVELDAWAFHPDFLPFNGIFILTGFAGIMVLLMAAAARSLRRATSVACAIATLTAMAPGIHNFPYPALWTYSAVCLVLIVWTIETNTGRSRRNPRISVPTVTQHTTRPAGEPAAPQSSRDLHHDPSFQIKTAGDLPD